MSVHWISALDLPSRPSLPMMLLRCFSTVRMLQARASAICAEVSPLCTARSTAFSVVLKASRGLLGMVESECLGIAQSYRKGYAWAIRSAS